MKLKETGIFRKIRIIMKSIKFVLSPGYSMIMLLLGMILLMTFCQKDEEDILFTGDEYQNLLQYIDSSPEEYSSFRRIIEVGRLVDVLSSYNSHTGGNSYTLFLPDNDAVQRFIDENPLYNSLDELLRDTTYTRALARYHVLNVEVLSFDFVNGALPDKTLSEEFVTIIFNEEEGGDIFYFINNESLISQVNIEKSNGIIHLIEKMLTPVVYTGYEWVQTYKNNGYGIFSELLEITGLEDTMNYFEFDELGRQIYNEYTLFVESDDLYNANDIFSIDDLILQIGEENTDYLNPGNSVNKYARYHILSQSIFLDEFKTGLYNTYGDFPVSVDFESLDLKINKGSQVFDSVIVENDTIPIDYLSVVLEHSNIIAKTGAIHQLDQVLFPFLPGRKSEVFQFYEDYQIFLLRNEEGSTDIRKEDLDVIDLFGVDFLTYTKSGTSINGVSDRDYITVSGNFEFTYHLPRILAGTYEVRIVAQRDNRSNAILQVYLDGNKLGNVVDLTSGGSNTSEFSPEFVQGTVEFAEYEDHEIKLRTLVPGDMQLDRIIFKPVSY